MVYIWSDLHLGHANIIEYGERPFRDVDEMDTTLLNAWRSKIKPKDVLINLGDFMFNPKKESLTQTLHNLPGYKILILGNHDRGKSFKWWMEAGFDEVYKYPIIYKDKYILSHEPIEIDENMNYINIHGHIHNKTTENKKQVNVSVEMLGYKPMLFEKIQKTAPVKL
jgi:calcineurin-like phosphoesterase family protein